MTLVRRQCRFIVLADLCGFCCKIEQRLRNAEKLTRVRCANGVTETSESGGENNVTLLHSIVS